MTTASNVAKYYLAKETLSPKKLQKIVYYAYGWTLALLNDTIDDLHYHLFPNRIEAWVHGPVIPDLYHEYKNHGGGDISRITDFDDMMFSTDEKDILEQVWDVYGSFTANELELISHKETPWISARNGIPACSPSSNLIKDEDIFAYYNKQAES